MSGRITALLVDSLEQRGLDLGACLGGTGLTRTALLDAGARFDWETYVELLHGIERVCGGPAQLERLFIAGVGERTGHPYVRVARAFLRLPDLYRLVARWGIPRDVAVAHASFEQLDRDRGRLTIDIDPGRVGSLPFFHSFAGVARSLPGLVDLPDAEVHLTASPHQGIYEIGLPPPPRLVKRLKRAASVLTRASSTLDTLEAQTDEIRAKNAQLEAQLAAQRTVENDLREQQAWLRLALDAGRLGIWSWDVREDRLRWSSGVDGPQRLDRSPGSLADYLALVHPDDRAALERTVRETAAHGTELENEHRVVRSGSVTWARVKGRVLRDEAGAPLTMTGTISDVSETKRLEAQLLFADRMISVGKLAASVAHELNNPLAYVMTNLSLVRMQLSEGRATAALDPREVATSLDALAEGVERMNHIMGDLRAFSRPEEERRSVVELSRIVEAAVRLVSNEIRHRAELVTEFAADAPSVLANESRLGQVLTNLLVNAAHAITESFPPHGIIRISTYRNADGRAVTAIHDNGRGMGPETLRRIFEPFFTTKEIGEGTGLGLAVCESIVRSMGGTIEVESEVGRGSTFRIVLPAAEQPARAPAAPPAPRTTGGRILVIDDEAMLRTSLKALLEAYDFEVTLAATGRAALALALALPPFDVILCDLMMPGMTGMDVHAELARENPAVARRMVFMTGGAFTARAREFIDGVDSPHIDKPFALESLLEVIETTKTRS